MLVGWRGPQWRKPDDLTALHVLWTYLTDSPVRAALALLALPCAALTRCCPLQVAPLQQRFVELDEPCVPAPRCAARPGADPSARMGCRLCNDVTFHLERFSTSSLQVEFHNVKTELLGAVESTLLEELRAQAEGALDMEASLCAPLAARSPRLPHTCRTVRSDSARWCLACDCSCRASWKTRRTKCCWTASLATSSTRPARIRAHAWRRPPPARKLTRMARPPSAAEAAWLRDSVDVLAALEALPLKDSDAGWWRSFLRQWALEAPRVVVVGRPSADMAQRMVQEEKQRVRDQVRVLPAHHLRSRPLAHFPARLHVRARPQATRLGAHKLRELATQLEAACRENSRVPDTPEHFPSPSLHRVEFQAVASVRRMRAWEAKAAAADDRWVVEASGSTPEGERACASVLEHLRAAGLSESSGLPVFLQIDHVRSNFVQVRHACPRRCKRLRLLTPDVTHQVTATLDTRDLAPEQRLLLPLLRDLLAELPVNDETEPGMVQSLTYEQVVEVRACCGRAHVGTAAHARGAAPATRHH